MCKTLQAHGFPGGELLPLGPAAPYPVNSAVVVATPAVRSQFGSSLAAAYAPAVLASFGTGIARIDIRVIAPHGAAAYLADLKADVTYRKDSAPELLRSRGLPSRRRRPGSSRLAVSIAGSWSRWKDCRRSSPMTIVDFGDSGPGASAGIPLRSVDLTGNQWCHADPQLPVREVSAQAAEHPAAAVPSVQGPTGASRRWPDLPADRIRGAQPPRADRPGLSRSCRPEPQPSCPTLAQAGATPAGTMVG